MIIAYEKDGVRMSEDPACLEIRFGTEVAPADFCFVFENIQEVSEL